MLRTYLFLLLAREGLESLARLLLLKLARQHRGVPPAHPPRRSGLHRRRRRDAPGAGPDTAESSRRGRGGSERGYEVACALPLFYQELLFALPAQPAVVPGLAPNSTATEGKVRVCQ